MKQILLASAAALALSACATTKTAEAPAAAVAVVAAPAAPKPQIGDWGFDLAGMDRATAPGDDWVKFANGTYLSKLEIPADRSNFGMFTKLRDQSQQQTREIIEAAAAAGGAPGSAGQKVGDYYASFLDEAAIEARGLTPIQPDLDRIAAIKTRADIAKAFGEDNRYGMDVPIGVGVIQDLKDNTKHSVYVGQGGLGMPDRDYYLDDSNPKFVETRAKYQAHLAKMMSLAGISDAEARAKRVYDLEKQIAQFHWTRVQQRQIDKLYNPATMAELAKKYPGFDWAGYLAAAGIPAQPQIVITNPSAIAGIAKLVSTVPVQTWRDYLTVHTIKSSASVLPKAFVDENFAFNGTVLSGQPQIQPRWKRGVDAVNGAMGEAVGELYVAKYFPPEAKAKADELVKNIIAAMDQRLAALTWMAPETKAKARAKLAAFTPKIGYPDKWRDYSALEIVKGDAYGNAKRAVAFEYQRNIDKLGKPVDRGEWQMTPMTVNAYANPLLNEIVFPAAILQPPFFDPNADPAVNYGGIGMVIGHEISHHFDDQGRKFDPQGNLTDWWTPEDVARFKVLTDKVVAQYGAYEPLPGRKINGELTLGENMADLAGITIAYDAYKMSLGGKEDRVIDGLTGDQRFFLGSAQIWRQKYRDAALQQQLTTDPHTAGHFRPYVVRNLDAWYAAWGAKPGEKLYLSPEQRVKVW